PLSLLPTTMFSQGTTSPPFSTLSLHDSLPTSKLGSLKAAMSVPLPVGTSPSSPIFRLYRQPPSPRTSANSTYLVFVSSRIQSALREALPTPASATRSIDTANLMASEAAKVGATRSVPPDHHCWEVVPTTSITPSWAVA